MAAVAVGLHLEEARAVARARPLDGLADRRVDDVDVLAVDDDPGHAVRIGAPGEVASRRWSSSASGEYSPYRLFVMMNTTGAFQRAAMLSASWNVPMLVAPSPKKLSATLRPALHLEADRRPDRDRQPGADDGVRADVALREVDQVHRAADAARAAGALAHQLGERGLGRHPERERLAVAAVGVRLDVAGAHRGDRADRDGLLALAQMRRARRSRRS